MNILKLARDFIKYRQAQLKLKDYERPIKGFIYPSDIPIKDELDIYKEELLEKINKEYQHFDWCDDSASDTEKAEAWENYGKNKALNIVKRFIDDK